MDIHKRTEKDWDAIYDAQTLANAEIIKGNPSRLKSAKGWAAKLAKEEGAQKAALEKIAEG